MTIKLSKFKNIRVKCVTLAFEKSKKRAIVEMLTDSSIQKNGSAVNQMIHHKSKTIYKSLAKNQCVIPFISMSPLPCKYKTLRDNIFSNKKKLWSQNATKKR